MPQINGKEGIRAADELYNAAAGTWDGTLRTLVASRTRGTLHCKKLLDIYNLTASNILNSLSAAMPRRRLKGGSLMGKEMTQVKFSIESDIVSAFKSRCAAGGVSMASVIREWMKTCQPTKEVEIKTVTRPQRREAVAVYIGILNGILDDESGYRDNIPEQFTQKYEAAEYSCDKLEEAISCLEEAY